MLEFLEQGRWFANLAPVTYRQQAGLEFAQVSLPVFFKVHATQIYGYPVGSNRMVWTFKMCGI